MAPYLLKTIPHWALICQRNYGRPHATLYSLLTTRYNIRMGPLRILSAYFVWHYSQGIADLTHLFGSFILFFWHFFSIPTLLRTLLAPWRKMNYKIKNPGLDVEGFFGDLIISLLMRIVGVAVKIPTILFGLLLLVITCILYPIFFVLWLLLPFLAILLIIFGIWVTVAGL